MSHRRKIKPVPTGQMKRREIIQIQTLIQPNVCVGVRIDNGEKVFEDLFVLSALCSDGTLWELIRGEWRLLKPIPQGAVKWSPPPEPEEMPPMEFPTDQSMIIPDINETLSGITPEDIQATIDDAKARGSDDKPE